MQPNQPPLQPVPSTVNIETAKLPDGSNVVVFNLADVTGSKTHFWPVDFAKQVRDLLDAKIKESGSGLIVPSPSIDLSKIMNGHGGNG